MPKPLIAYCYASGQIRFGYSVPAGAIEIARGKASVVRRQIAATSRIAYDNKTLLVPGVPEAVDQETACDALIQHRAWLAEREVPGFVVCLGRKVA